MGVVGGKKQSTVQGIFNLLLTAVGVGVLALSTSVAQSGWILGFSMLFLFGLLAIYLCYLLDDSMRMAGTLTKTETNNYEDIGRAAMGTNGVILTAIPLHLSLVGCCCALLGLLAENTMELLKRFYPSFSGGHRWMFVLAWGVIMLPLVSLKTMKYVGMVSSTVGVGAVFMMCFSIIIGGFQIFSKEYESNIYPKSPTSWLDAGGAFAAFTLAYAVTCTVPTNIRDLKNREKSKTVLKYGLLITIVFYFLISLSGFLAFGIKTVNDPICKSNIVNLFPATAWHGVVAKLALIIACACHYAVMLHPTCRIIEDITNTSDHFLWRTSMRWLLVGITIGLSVVIENLRTYVSVLGSVTFAIIHSFLPPLFYMQLCNKTGNVLSSSTKLGLYGLMLMTIIGGAFGLTNEIRALTS
jgi:solute carrier family 32 (vesicular inhibitory amino acid transporter)